MHTVTVNRSFDFAADRVWALLDDFANTWVYHPIVERSMSVNGIRGGLGAQRQCNMYSGDAIQEKVVEHDADRYFYRIEVVEHGPFPTTEMIVAIKVEPKGAAACVVTYDLEFDVKYGPIGWVMGKAMMAPNMKKMLGELLEGVQAHLETGRIVEKGGTLGAALEPSALAA